MRIPRRRSFIWNVFHPVQAYRTRKQLEILCERVRKAALATCTTFEMQTLSGIFNGVPEEKEMYQKLERALQENIFKSITED